MSARSVEQPSELDGMISNDELAARLIQCATIVKKGEKSQLIRDTIYDLTYYLTGKVPNGSRGGPTVLNSATASAPKSTTQQPQTGPGDSSTIPIPVQGVQKPQTTPVIATSKSENAVSSDGTATRHHPLHSTRPTPNDVDSVTHLTSTVINNVNNTTMPGQHVSNRPVSSQQQQAQGAAVEIGSSRPNKPVFHRPMNQSAVIANGWIEQNRRSRLRSVWKEVLVSLVEGRKPGDETTFWVQRETGTYNNGKPQLEALHQIPAKWILEVRYEEFSTDYRFSLRVNNVAEGFLFRCVKSQEGAQNWVLTLRSAAEASRSLPKTPGRAIPTALDQWEEEGKTPDHHHPEHSQRTRQNLQTPNAHAQHPQQQMQTTQQPQQPQQPQQQQKPPPQQQQQQQNVSDYPASGPTQRMSVKELRAIAHGAGIMTHGMERRDLERVVEELARTQIGANVPNPHAHPPQQMYNVGHPPLSAPTQRLHIETPPSSFGVPPSVPPAFAVRPGAPVTSIGSSDSEDRKGTQPHETELEKRRREEEERLRLEQQRLRKEEEAHLKRVAEMQAKAERQRQEEMQRKQQQQWQSQQSEWQKQQEEQRVAEERRRQEEALRAQQQWKQQQQQGPFPPQQQPWTSPPPQQPNLGGQPYPGPNPHQPQPPFAPGQHPQQQPQPSNQPGYHRSTSAPNVPPPQNQSAANLKYAKMAQQTDDDSLVALNAIKHGVLLQWALCPPTMQILKPIEHLLAEMPNVFPPKFNVPRHEHFTKWTPMRPEEVCSGPGRPDPEKLNKTMRRLRLFLHPDKLPRDFTKEQEHLCKLLWDITSDAYEDFKKAQEDLGWIRS